MKYERNSNDYDLEDLEKLMDNIPYALWLKDENNVYKYVNKSFLNSFNIKKEDVLGKEKINSRNEFDTDRSSILSEEYNEIYDGDKLYSICKTQINKGDSIWTGGISKEIAIDKNIDYEVSKRKSEIFEDYNNHSNNNENRLNKVAKELCERLQAEGISIELYYKKDKTFKTYLTIGRILEREIYDYSIYNNELVFKKNNQLNSLNSEFICRSKNYNNYIDVFNIKYEGEYIGILNIYYSTNKNVKYEQIDFILSTCDRFATIIKNQFLLKELKKELNRRIESEKELELFLDTATDLCAIINKDGYYRRTTNSWTKILGWSEDEINKMNYRDLIHPEDLKFAEEARELSIKNGNKIGFIDRFLCKNGEYKLIEWNWRLLGDGNTIVTGKDKTEEQRLEIEKKRLEDAIALESLKTEFFANMSHEFKTPLNIILTTVQLVSKYLETSDYEINDKSIIRYMNGIKQNSYRLLRLVNNLIDITKIDGGYYDLNIGNHNIVSVIEDIVLSVSDYIGNKGKSIIFDTCEEEIVLACDPDKIERIMLNLLSNAIKYTNENGKIEVNLNINKEKQRVIVSVKNDGPQIPKEDSKKIFKRFAQSEKLSKIKCEGSGIGLSLVKALVDLHGGEIWINDKIENGAEFIFELPIKTIKNEKKLIIQDKQLDDKVEKCNVEFSNVYTI